MKQTDLAGFSDAEARRDAIGFALAARLAEASQELPHDISERLRVARQQALARRKQPLPVRQVATAASRFGSEAALAAGDEEGKGFWPRLIVALPIFALVAGLFAINFVQTDHRAHELAEIDAALLTDDLPPAAYADPGFGQFLKWSRDQAQ